MVSTSTRGPPASRRVASIPSITGMRTSISATSGSCSEQTRTASAPSAAGPTTEMSGWVSSNAPNPARTTCWSSATTTRITGARPAARRPREPPPLAAPVRSEPPTIATRSRMPCSPWPSPSPNGPGPWSRTRIAMTRPAAQPRCRRKSASGRAVRSVSSISGPSSSGPPCSGASARPVHASSTASASGASRAARNRFRLTRSIVARRNPVASPMRGTCKIARPRDDTHAART